MITPLNVFTDRKKKVNYEVDDEESSGADHNLMRMRQEGKKKDLLII